MFNEHPVLTRGIVVITDQRSHTHILKGADGGF